MKKELKENLVKRGVQTLYREFGPVKTVKFFQLVGINKGDTLREIEEITKKMTKKEALAFVRNKAVLREYY